MYMYACIIIGNCNTIMFITFALHGLVMRAIDPCINVSPLFCV